MPTGLTRESHAACGLALPGFVEPVGVAGRGLTQQRIDRLPELEVGVSSTASLLEVVGRKVNCVVIIGVDPHKRTHTASAMHSDTSRVLTTMQIDASLSGYRRLLTWRLTSTSAGGRWKTPVVWVGTWLNGCSPSVRSSRTCPRPRQHGSRALSRWPTQNDVIDAAAAASVAAVRGEANLVVAEDLTTVLALLDERRDNVITQRSRLINQLHALLRDLVPGGARVNLTALAASRVLATVRAAGPVEAARKQMARDLLAEIRDADQQLTTLTGKIAATVAEHGSNCPPSRGSGRSLPGDCWDAPVGLAGSPAPRRLPTTPASHLSKSPAATTHATACPAAVTASSTSRCTSSRSPKGACQQVGAAPTTTQRSLKARPATKPCAA